ECGNRKTAIDVLRLSLTAKWLTPSGNWVHGIGLTPDIVITPKDTDKEDVILQGAIDLFD
ncbi:MAG: hypothetical protein UT58_C0024G0001, partial [Microgenomates group bacterium GW2011_GWC1_39_7b]